MAVSQPTMPTESSERGIDLGRILALSDGVFAFALTLLVLDIKLSGVASSDLPHAIVALGPRVASYLLGFFVIGSEWNGYQHTMRYLTRGTTSIVWLNLVALLFVTFRPATTALLGAFPTEFIGISCFAVNSMLSGLVMWVMWRYITGSGLLRPGVHPREIEMIDRLWVMNPIAFGLTIPLALLNVYLVYPIWIAVGIVSHVWPRRLVKELAAARGTR